MEITAITRFKLGALYKLLRKLGWSQSGLAARCGVNTKTISGVINLKHRPSAALANKIQAAFGEAGEYVDVLEIWPESFAGFGKALVIEETKEIAPAALSFTNETPLLESYNIDPVLFNQAWAKLRDQEREVLNLHYGQGLDYAEIGRRLGRSRSVIQRRRDQAIRSIWHSLNPVTSHAGLPDSDMKALVEKHFRWVAGRPVLAAS